MFGVETQGTNGFKVKGEGKEEVGSVWESWRVVEYLHAQALFTLHQAAANKQKEKEGEEDDKCEKVWKRLEILRDKRK